MNQNLTFTDFVEHLGLRTLYPEARDCTRTRLKDGPELDIYTVSRKNLTIPERGHRCHLSEMWATRMGMDNASKENILVSKGVRHSLEILMRGWAALGYVIALPLDVYPVYLQIAQKVGIKHIAYPLHPYMEPVGWQQADVLLTTNPVKPRGDHLAEREVDAIQYWLGQERHRRVVIDAVYDAEPALNHGTRELMATDQAIVLHSLSKIWLEPLAAGVCLVPPNDSTLWTPVFRQEEVDRNRLALAEAWMRQAPAFPEKVAIEFVRLRAQLAVELTKAGLRLVPEMEPQILQKRGTRGTPAPGYLLQVEGSFDEVLKRGFFGMPQSIFGGRQENVTVLSALPMR